jgi:Holliday junction resolvase RusA-like endonuclease
LVPSDPKGSGCQQTFAAAVERSAKVSGVYGLRVVVPATARADLDNYAKPLGDLLQAHNVIENDRLCRRLLIERGNVAERELMVATATAVDVGCVRAGRTE